MLDIRKVCEVLYVTVHRPRLVYAIKGDVEVDGIQLTDEKATKPSWRLMPTAMAKDLGAAAYAVTKYLEDAAIPLRGMHGGQSERKKKEIAIPGTYVIPRHRVGEITAGLRERSEAMKEVVRTHAGNRREFLAAVKAKVGEAAYNAAVEHIPDLWDMIESTGVRVISLPLQTDMDAIESANMGEIDDELRRETRNAMSALVESVVAQPRQELAAALSQLDTLLNSEDHVVSARSIAPVSAAIAKLRSFDFAMDETLRANLKNLEGSLETFAGQSAADRRINASALSQAVQALRDEATNATQISQHVTFLGRRVRAAAVSDDHTESAA